MWHLLVGDGSRRQAVALPRDFRETTTTTAVFATTTTQGYRVLDTALYYCIIYMVALAVVTPTDHQPDTLILLALLDSGEGRRLNPDTS